ncbi:MAG: C4-type zinc ribbon domain-containing protein [Meiothermus sp.]|uniref:zinc ribbon domain-containing protein n=1 Tax=Meiothermus sp. TaxID=1955249 RepID=UPI0025E1FA18|nr:C4-type zinc ribbon domain-containing protein [Meiothermus sp.]MCS7069268.1 C4-type zinc ribbon domain-containing protein [Meiothermus sp.]MCX7600859.1 C4-type zinc ribbon domain-containing protein [Meiothermus sp.]MDW8425366.1 C4-type zinc ribbon domain-containing protein [Meiothermus sp.]
MSDPLAELNRLQERDLELDQIREDQSRIPEDLAQARLHLRTLEDRLADLQDQLREVNLAYHKVELELQDLKSKREKARAAQAQASSAKEQTQYGEQIRQLDDRIEEIEGSEKKNVEGQMAPLVEQIYKLEEELAQVKAQVDEARPRLEALEAANQQRVNDLEATYQSQKADRDRLAATIPAPIVKEYESIRKARKGTGLARMAKTGNGYRCTACNVQLPMHVAQQIHQAQKVVRCPSCGRILWKGE